MALKTLILSVLTFFLIAGSALAIPVSDSFLRNYFDTTSLRPKSVDYQMMPMNYSLVGEKLAANHDINDETIVTQSSDYQTFYFETRTFVSYGSRVAKDADSCMFVGDIVELSIIPPVINRIASVPEPATIVFMGLGLFSLGGWARRLREIKKVQ
ncbi:MAG: PEP-CTERM sorting domain-containing protein [Deltaproteobacteria bacterium]|nr:PEP-CTERM sorting domain-containing protein [Deltaproteobacteria bacterium]